MAKDKRDGKAALPERLCRVLDIQPDVFPGGTLIEIRGRNSLTVRGSGRITYYTENEIRIATRNGEVLISGCRLFCSAYHKGAVVIDGHICGVRFEEGRK